MSQIIDSEGRELKSKAPAPEGMVRGEDMIEHRVALTRREFAEVATSTYEPGRRPEHGGPIVRVVDKRGKNNAAAAAHKAEQEARRGQRIAQAAWARQAAGTMWWLAQGHAQRGNEDLAEHTLAKRAELVAGATREGIL